MRHSVWGRGGVILTRSLPFPASKASCPSVHIFSPLSPPSLQVAVGSSSPFACLTRRGVISGGRQFEMVFEYVPTTDSIAESFWMFRIPEQGIEVPFLVVSGTPLLVVSALYLPPWRRQ